jgi:hypothetical protein
MRQGEVPRGMRYGREVDLRYDQKRRSPVGCDGSAVGQMAVSLFPGRDCALPAKLRRPVCSAWRPRWCDLWGSVSSRTLATGKGRYAGNRVEDDNHMPVKRGGAAVAGTGS